MRGGTGAAAYRNDDVRALNHAIHARRQARASSARPSPSAPPSSPPGDRVVFLRNDRQGRQVSNLDPAAAPGVNNGTLGTLETAASERFTVRLDDGRRVGFDPRDYDAIAHGYAVTIHKSQGATVDHAYLLADYRHLKRY